jgi:hypothetical protein
LFLIVERARVWLIRRDNANEGGKMWNGEKK